MFFRSPLPSLGLLKTVTHVLAILLPMSWPCFVTYVLASDPPERPNRFTGENRRIQLVDTARSINAPSRGPAPHHGSASRWSSDVPSLGEDQSPCESVLVFREPRPTRLVARPQLITTRVAPMPTFPTSPGGRSLRDCRCRRAENPPFGRSRERP